MTLLTIEDLVVEKDGTMLYLPVIPCPDQLVLSCLRINMYACIRLDVIQESLSRPTLQFEDLKAMEAEPGAVRIKALAILPPPTQVNPL